MDHDKSRSRVRKDFYIAPLVIALVMAVMVAVIIARRPPESEPAKAPRPVAAAAPSAKPGILPVDRAPLTRADLLAAARQAASDYAAGKSSRSSADADALKGRRFSLRIPFGCDGAYGVVLNPHTAISYDAGRASITITAQPGLWTSLPVMLPFLQAAKAETVEGFWLPRPWTQSEACPRAGNASLPAISTPVTAQTVGLAQIFAPGSSRAQRHAEHPYSVTRKLAAADTEVLSHSYHLILEGTVTGYPDGRPLHCWSESPDHHPICIFAVTLERVAFEDAASGQILASWAD